MNRFEYARPTTLRNAVELHTEGALFKGAGTDLLSMVKDRLAAPKRIVSLLEIPGLKNIDPTADSIRIGALATHDDIDRHPEIRKSAAALSAAAAETATPQVRNVATLGGSLCQRPRCWYFRSADFPCRKKGGGLCYAEEGENQYHALFGGTLCHIVHPSNLAVALSALDARLEIHADGATRTLTMEQFFDVGERIDVENALAPGEIVTAAVVPRGWKSSFLEVRERQSFDWPLVSVAVARKGRDVRVVFGSVAPRPWRIAEVEQAVATGKVKDAVEIIAGKARPMTKNRYKIALLQALLPRAVDALR